MNRVGTTAHLWCPGRLIVDMIDLLGSPSKTMCSAGWGGSVVSSGSVKR